MEAAQFGHDIGQAWHAPAPGHLPAGETVVFRDDDRSQVGGPDVAARHKAENEDLVAQLQFGLVLGVGVARTHGGKLGRSLNGVNSSGRVWSRHRASNEFMSAVFNENGRWKT